MRWYGVGYILCQYVDDAQIYDIIDIFSLSPVLLHDWACFKFELFVQKKLKT